MLTRFKPSPIPALNPVPEYKAQGRIKELYEETKQVLQVPWMGVVTMSLAHYQDFYETLLQATGPMLASTEAVSTYRSLRQEIEAEVQKFKPPKRSDTLLEMSYSPRELDDIRETIEVFSHGNFPYTMMATLSRMALEMDEFPTRSAAKPYEGRHAPNVDVPFVILEEHHADDQTKAVYGSIRSTLGLPFVNTDYRGFARWPTYFRMAWGDLAPVVATKDYEDMVARLHGRFVEEASKLPNPTGAVAADIKAAATKSASIEEVLQVNQLFQWLLPGLIANVAFFREQLR